MEFGDVKVFSKPKVDENVLVGVERSERSLECIKSLSGVDMKLRKVSEVHDCLYCSQNTGRDAASHQRHKDLLHLLVFSHRPL